MRLVGLLDTTGVTLSPADAAKTLGVAVGDVIEPLGAEANTAIAATGTACAPHEGHWRTRLAQVDVQDLPFFTAVPEKTDAAAVPKLASVTLKLLGKDTDTDAPADPGTILAGFGLWLCRASGQESVDVGYVAHVATGPHTDIFEAMPPARFRYGVHNTLAELHATTQQELDRLNKRMTYARDLIPRTPGLKIPAWQVAVDTRPDALRLATGPLSPFSMASASGNPALAMVLSVADGAAQLTYNPLRLDPKTAEAITAQIETVIAAFQASGETLAARTPLMPPAEEQKVLRDWNQTAVDYPDVCMHQLFEAQVEKTPDAVALVFENESFTYGDLESRANQLAHVLLSKGVGPDVLVGLYMDRRPDLVIGVLAIHKAGGAYVPLDPAYPADRVALMIEDSNAQVIVTRAALAQQVPLPENSQAQLLVVDGQDAQQGMNDAQGISPRPQSDVTPAHLAYVIYTSGSTGRPKGSWSSTGTW